MRARDPPRPRRGRPACSAGWVGGRCSRSSAAPAFRARNYRGADVPTASGIVIVLAVRGRRGRGRGARGGRAGPATWPPTPAARPCWWPRVGFGFLGLLDDLAGAESGGGFRRHLAALARRPAHDRRRQAGRRGAGGGGRRRARRHRRRRLAAGRRRRRRPGRQPGQPARPGARAAPSRSGVVAFAVLAAVDGATAALAGPGRGRRGGRRPGRARPAGAGHARRHRRQRARAPPSAWPPCWCSTTPPPLVVLVVLLALNLVSEWVSFSG